MSTTLIVALVVGGLAIVIAIGFFSQAVERARLEKARAVAELHARWNHCNGINAALPGQFMSPDLKKLLLTVEAALLERLLSHDPRHEAAGRLAKGREQLAGAGASAGNPEMNISDETAAQKVRQQLGELLRVLELARQDGLIDDGTLLRWSQKIRRQRTEVTLNMLRALAEAAMQAGKPRVAKLQYERAVAYLSKQGANAPADQLAVFRHLLIQAEQAAAQMERAAPGTALSEGVQALEEDDQAWRKKALYDD